MQGKTSAASSNREISMRFLAKATIPVEAGNALVRDPNFSKRMESLLADIKPEAAYFAAEGGQRVMYLIVQMADASQFPSLAEPLWLSLKANVEFIPLMNQADMAKATPSIIQAAKKYPAGDEAAAAGAGRPARARETAGRGASRTWSS